MEKKEFYEAVYKIIGQIPKGKVMTYGQIGLILGSKYYARRVGQAMKNIPKDINIPCHRVINSKGGLAPAHVFGGKNRQAGILMDEGVVFKENGSVNLKKSIWFYF